MTSGDYWNARMALERAILAITGDVAFDADGRRSTSHLPEYRRRMVAKLRARRDALGSPPK